MKAADNKEIIRTFIEACNNRDMQGVLQSFAQRYIYHSLYDAVDPTTGDKTSNIHEYALEDIEKSFAHDWEHDPDGRMENEWMLDAEDNKVVHVTTITGAHKSGKKYAYQQLNIDRVEDGKIAESWETFDRMGYWQQLGIVPPTSELVKKRAEL